MSAPPSPKQRILEAVQRLPADASFEDVMERLYFLYKVEQGLADVEAGRVVPHEDVKRMFGL
jgi:predicted transcriptional regulator